MISRLFLVLAVAGCADRALDLPESAPADLAASDLAFSTDLAPNLDLSTPPDLAPAVDLGPDLAGPQLTLMAGALGGSGNADDVGGDARLDEPFGADLDSDGNLYFADSRSSVVKKLELATGRFTTLAGKAGVMGGADGIGADARFDWPIGVTLDGRGGLFVVDEGYAADAGNLLRRIDLATLQVSTVAGHTNQICWGGIDGTGSGVCWDGIGYATSDGAGGLYILDFNYLRHYFPDHSVHTLVELVDENGRQTSSWASTGITRDESGYLYYLLQDQPYVMRIDLAAGTTTPIELVRGGVRVDQTDDYRGFLTRAGGGGVWVLGLTGELGRVNLSTGEVTHVASGILQHRLTQNDDLYSFFLGIVPGVDGKLYLSLNDDGGEVLSVDPSSGAVETLAGRAPAWGASDGIGGAARFSAPHDLVALGDDLYVNDWTNGSVRAVGPGGQVTTLATGFVRPTSLARNDQWLYLAEEPGTLAVVYFHGSGFTVSAPSPAPMTATSDGTQDGLYLAFNQSIWHANQYSSSPTLLAGAGTWANDPPRDGTGGDARFSTLGALLLDGDSLYAVEHDSGRVRAIDVTTGRVTTLVSGLAGPTGLARDGSGRFLIADERDATVKRFDPASGALTTLIGVSGVRGVKLGPLPARLNQPWGVAVTADGALVISDAAENCLLEAR